MSKSLGNVLDPFEVIERFGADALRFYLLPRGQLRPGRLDLHRRLRGPLRDRARQRLRQPRQPDAGDGRALPRRRRARGRRRPGAGRGLRRRRGEVRELLDRAELTQALEEAWSRCAASTATSRRRSPWELAKDEGDPERLDEVLYNLAEGLRVTTLLLVPTCRRPREAARRAGRGGTRAGRAGLARRRRRVERIAAALPEDRGLDALLPAHRNRPRADGHRRDPDRHTRSTSCSRSGPAPAAGHTSRLASARAAPSAWRSSSSRRSSA